MDNGELTKVKDKIRKKFPEINFPDVAKEPAWWGRREHYQIDDRCALIGTSEGERRFYNFASEDYLVVHHEEFLDHAMKTIKKMGEFGKPEVKPKLLCDGARMEADIFFPDIEKPEIQKGDNVEPKLTLFNSYDLSWQARYQFGANRLICTNGMVAFKVLKELKSKHRTSLSMSGMSAELAEGMAAYSEQTELWRSWADRQLQPGEVEELWEPLDIGERYKQQILELPETGTGMTIGDFLNAGSISVWNLHSILTQFATHELESDLVRIDRTETIGRVFHRKFPNGN